MQTRPFGQAVTEREALSVIAKLKQGKSSVMEQARLLGVYHATLRKAMRAAIGSKHFDAMQFPKRGKRKQRRRSKSVAASARVVAASPPVPQGCAHRFRAGTNGNGGAFVWCADCGHTEPVERKRLPHSPVWTLRSQRGELLSEDELRALVGRIESGTSDLGIEARQLGVSRSAVKKGLLMWLGFEKYEAVLSERARNWQRHTAAKKRLQKVG